MSSGWICIGGLHCSDTIRIMRWDVAVIGGGHNSLVAAAYLARAGLRTVLLERRPVLGGTCVTEELWPGFRVSRTAYVAGLLRPGVVQELGLAARGLRLLARAPSSFTPLPDGRGLLLGPDQAASQDEIRRFSQRDAERYPAYEQFLNRVARAFEPLLDAPPPDPGRPRCSPARAPCSSAPRAPRSRPGSRASPSAAPWPRTP
jgi:phytoene dehydrogenase-like protein